LLTVLVDCNKNAQLMKMNSFSSITLLLKQENA
jgi:hypothetical protein